MDCRKELKTLVYQNSKKAWVSAQFTPEDTYIDLVETLNFLTYNVWHKKDSFEERSAELLKIIQESSADFICLQEVTQPFLRKLMDAKWVQEDYYLPEIHIENYTTLILSKLPCRFYMRQWPTRMERFLLYGEVEINGIMNAIATVHLESLTTSHCRKKQLDITFEELSSYPKAVILGDFNFDWATENKHIAPHYVDIWPFIHPGSPGCTMPKTHDFIAWRPDRVLVKKNRKYKPIAIERVGMDPLPKFLGGEIPSESTPDKSKELDEHAIKTPSDHYGLKFVLEMLDNTKDEWTFRDQRSKDKVYRERRKGRFIWIDRYKKDHENSFYYEEIEKAITGKKGEVKEFEKAIEALDDVLFKLEETDDLTLIVSLSALHEILNSWKKELKVIQDKFVHEKHFRFRVIVFTMRRNYDDAMELCKNAGFERFDVFTRFNDVMRSLTIE